MEKSILEMVGGEKYLHYDVDNKAAKEYTTLQERIEQLEEINSDLKQSLDWANEREKENTERIVALEEANTVLERRIERAKRCMKKLMFIINSDPANYNCKGLMQDAEDFIHNRICNIRQLGEHCISETRCIMCDMGDKND
jgi:hypothetical protein